MKIYAATPGRRSRQVVADVFFLGWAALWIWLATKLYGLVMALTAPGEALVSGGETLSSNMVAAGEQIDNLPVVGEGVRTPFDRMSEAGQAIADAGLAQQDVITRLAWFVAICLAIMPILLLLIVWLPLRLRFIRRASAAQRFIDSADDLDLFALRALARQPMHLLARIDDDPAGAWRRKDPVVLTALAELELRDTGLSLPADVRMRQP